MVIKLRLQYYQIIMMKKKQFMLTLTYGQISNEKYVLKHLISLLFVHFWSSLFNNFKKSLSKRNHPNG